MYNMNKLIGLDIDGVLCSFSCGVLRRAKLLGYENEFPKTREDIKEWNVAPRFAEVMKDAWTDPEFWLELPPLRDGNLPFMPECYITSRPIDTEITERWLHKHGFPKKPVITVSRPEQKIEHIKDLKLDIFVDDLFSTVRQLREEGINALLYAAPYQVGHKDECEGLPTIARLEEVLEYV